MSEEKIEEKATEPTEKKEPKKENILSDWKEVLKWCEKAGRKTSKSKLFRDISAGKLRKVKEGFREVDVKRYSLGLQMVETPIVSVNDVEDRMRRKDEAEIRKLEAQAKREEFNLEVAQGKYIPTEDFGVEMAARCVALKDGLKSAVEREALNFIAAVGGDKNKTSALTELFERLIDVALDEFSRPLTLELDFDEGATAETAETEGELAGNE